MNRNALLDVSRAIAVMLVLTYHIWRDTGRPSFPIGDGFAWVCLRDESFQMVFLQEAT